MKNDSFNLIVNGEKVTNDLSHYKNGKAEKIILFCHGFPGTNRLVKLAKSLKNYPIDIVEINYRGDKKSEGKFSYLGSIEDVKTVATHLRNSFSSVKLYALGYSMGGFYVSSVIKDNPNLFDKVILLNPVVNTQNLFSNKPLMDELWVFAKNTISLQEPDFYGEEIKSVNESFNPVIFAAQLKTPIDIIQSTSDEILSPKDAEEFYSLLKCKKNYTPIPNAKHDTMGDESQLINAILQ